MPLLNKGITLAILSSEGNTPENIHLLNILVKTGAIRWRTCLIALTERSDDLLLLKEVIILTISSGSIWYRSIELEDLVPRNCLKSSGGGGAL